MDENNKHQALEQAVAGEMRLLEPGVRADPEQVDALLAPDFSEFGSSGRTYDRQEILRMLQKEQSGPGTGHPPRVRNMTGHLLAPDVVQLTFTTESDGHQTLRSSLWRRDTDGTWRCLFHQGTPAAPARDRHLGRHGPPQPARATWPPTRR